MNSDLERAIEMAIHRLLGNARKWTFSDILFRLTDDGINEDFNAISAIIDRMVEKGHIIRTTATNLNTGSEYNEYRLPDTRE